MKISELFFSIQGEGKRTGYPSYFIRTNYCNLRCKFSGGNLCDSYYTSWYTEDDYNRGDITLSEIINDYKKYGSRDIVITGGEPTIQLEELNALCSEIKKLNNKIFITIETNGTFIGDFIEYVDLVSISPKLKTSVPYDTEFEKIHEQNRINIDVFKEYIENYKKGLFDIQWKFVVTGENDVNEVFELRNQIGFKEKDVFLMPEGITRKDLEHNRSMTMELCKKYNLNYTDRLQVLVWGDKRGV
jgi:7-carboxy-7-deazaguanine synthase